ncbi:basic salivary proline-rich protein 2-like [Diceros bicornis minor]|uniref:basic salivary proline-rich protein 2-like n=1 Tax=Diceros bicornis minor TaxID=77932 RepID=UPI0026EC1114|nr:basic salivary proline-rich protein 2-like [Diceros bicornis minor]
MGQIRAFAVRATSPRFHGLLLSSDITGLIEALRGTRDAWNSELPSGETDKEAESPKEVPANRHPSKDSQRHAAGSARRDRSTHPRASPSDGGHTACTQPVSLHAAGRHTVVAVTRRGRWKRETTPPLVLRHLTDDLERSRGTTKDRATHTHTPGGACGRRPSTCPPTPPGAPPASRAGPHLRTQRLSENLAIEIQCDDPDPRGHVSGTGTPSPRPTLEGGGRSALSSGVGLEKHPSESPPTTGPPPRTARAGRSPPPERDSENAVRKVESDDPEPPVHAAEPPPSRPPRASPQGPGRSPTSGAGREQETGDTEGPTTRAARGTPAGLGNSPPTSPAPVGPRGSQWHRRLLVDPSGRPRTPAGLEERGDSHLPTLSSGRIRIPGRPGRAAGPPGGPTPSRPTPGPISRPGAARGHPPRGSQPARRDPGRRRGTRKTCVFRALAREGTGNIPSETPAGAPGLPAPAGFPGWPRALPGRFPGSREDSGKRGGRGTAKTKPGESSEDDDDRGTTEQLSASRHFQPATASQGGQAKPRGRRGNDGDA